MAESGLFGALRLSRTPNLVQCGCNIFFESENKVTTKLSQRRLRRSFITCAARKRGFGGGEPNVGKKKDNVEAETFQSEKAPEINLNAVQETSSGVRRRPAPEKPLIAAKASPQETQLDNSFLLAMGAIFALIFIEGTFLSVAGKILQLNVQTHLCGLAFTLYSYFISNRIFVKGT